MLEIIKTGAMQTAKLSFGIKKVKIGTAEKNKKTKGELMNMPKKIEIINGIAFSYVDTIKPFRDENGNIITFTSTIPKAAMHSFGDKTFCYFNVDEAQGKSGVYALFLNGECDSVYIGSTYNLAVRWSREQYGKINNSSCRKKYGQVTNCKVNAYIYKKTQEGKQCHLYFRQEKKYKELEEKLIEELSPLLNEPRKRLNNKKAGGTI